MQAFLLAGETLVTKTDPDDIARACEGADVVWVNLEGPSDSATALMQNVFHIHHLAIEDVWTERETPKVEDFDDYVHIIAHGFHHPAGARLSPVSIKPCEVDILLGSRFVITRATESLLVAPLIRELTRHPKMLARGPGWIAHALLDNLVDAYLPIFDALDEETQVLEDSVFEDAGTPRGRVTTRRIFELKRLLQRVRRNAVHQRDVLLRLSRGEYDEIPHDLLPFFRDVHDHFLRVSDLAEGAREALTSLLEAYLSAQGNRMNEVMKTLTSLSTVMLPLTFIAGVYGMNFRRMPELEWDYGYPAALLLMVITAVGIVLWFRRRHWV